MDNKLIIRFKNVKANQEYDIEIPADLTANELIYGLKNSFQLDINMDDPKDCFLRSENPIALIRGETDITSLGLRDGSVVFYEK